MFKLTRRSVPVLFAVFVFVLSACSSSPDKFDPNATPQQMYADAKGFMDAASYESAIKEYEKLQARFPYGNYAQQAELDVAYSHYKMGDVASTVASCDRFIKTHPNHPSVDYAYYLKGLANYIEDKGLLSIFSEQDLSDRDPNASQESFEAFRTLVTRFPNSRYAPDATQRMINLINAMAEHELHVARYYLKRRAPLAAINRAQAVVKSFPDSPAVEEALALMIQGYGELDMGVLKTDTERVLKQNFPNSRYLTASRK